MSIHNESIRYFRTTSFYPAAFLYAKGIELASIQRITSRRSEFVFVDSPKLQDLLHSYNFALENDPTALVDARQFEAAIKALKDRLYQTDD
jgi:hypothetical protein